MLRKLLRYEFKALLRILPALYLALLVLGVAAGVGSLIPGDTVRDWRNIPDLLMFALGLMLFAVFTVNLVTVIHRFRDNFLKDEGYLMFTLPVPEWKLAASKGIAALCTLILTGAAWLLAVLIYGFINDAGNMLEQLPALGEHLSGTDPLRVIAGTAAALVFILQQLYLAYASMTVSQLAPRFRGLAGFGVYLAVMIFVEYPITRTLYSLSHSHLPAAFFEGPAFFPAILLLEAVFAALYLWGVTWLLKHTVNLE